MDARLIQWLIEDGAIRMTPAVDHRIAEKLKRYGWYDPALLARIAMPLNGGAIR